jgi:electron transfer flavoprotein beta subunit
VAPDRAVLSEGGGAAVKIVVCVKQVPDSWAEKKLNPQDNTLDRDAVDAVVNELDEFAVEEALQLQ